MPAGHGLPQCQPKDSAAYRAWYAALCAGRAVQVPHAYEPRACAVSRGGCGELFVPRVGNQLRCDACIATGKRAIAERRAQWEGCP